MRVYVLLFKQKTAYEMRISDWSSDVCSSDLGRSDRRCRRASAGFSRLLSQRLRAQDDEGAGDACQCRRRGARLAGVRGLRPRRAGGGDYAERAAGGNGCHPRSEEHTSELQSLMRISYAVFCLKKKKND